MKSMVAFEVKRAKKLNAFHELVWSIVHCLSLIFFTMMIQNSSRNTFLAEEKTETEETS